MTCVWLQRHGGGGIINLVLLINFISNPLKLSYSAQSVQMTSQESEGLISISNNNNNFSMPPCTDPFLNPLHLRSLYRDNVP
jgi:hypothetical protein